LLREAVILSENTAAYCKARQRLPLTLAYQVLEHSGRAIRQRWAGQAEWGGRAVCWLDGSTLRLDAQAELIEYYGQPRGRRGQSHWPVMRVVAAMDAWSGAIQAVREGPYGESETSLAIRLFRRLQAGTVVVGDQVFGIYRVLQMIVYSHLDALVRVQAGHIRRWCSGSLPSGSDLNVDWRPSSNDQLLCGIPYAPFHGRLLFYRLQRNGFRPIPLYLFTTLTNRDLFPSEDLLRLYGLRWTAELHLRQVKTYLEMHSLSGKSLDMVRKELYLGLSAYNLIRALITEAAVLAHRSPLRLSFKHCWRRIQETLRSLGGPLALACFDRIDRQMSHLLSCLATCLLPKREPFRLEPRMIRIKPSPYPPLKGSRTQARLALLAQLQEC
jgi:hypothetical protein